MTDEQRSGRPKDRPFSYLTLFAFLLFSLYLFLSNAAVAIYEMVSKLMTQLIRLLLTIIPAERGNKLHEEPAAYHLTPSDLFNNPPMS